MIDLRSDLQPADAFGAASTRTKFGTYLSALLGSGAFYLVASLLVVTLSKPGRPNVGPAMA